MDKVQYIILGIIIGQCVIWTYNGFIKEYKRIKDK